MIVTTAALALRQHRFRFHSASSRTCIETLSISTRAFSISTENSFPTHPKYNHITIVGGGIAGLSTARYLLHHDNRINVTIIDKFTEIPNAKSYSTYDKQQIDLLHYNIPSRRNGNVLCPSLTVPWTTRSLWSEVFLPFLKSYFVKEKDLIRPQTISFDVPALLGDRSMWSFAYHFISQKFIYAIPKHHQCNKSILDYNMKCLDDPDDDLIQSIDYGRCATGTQLLDGTVISGDSSGDVGLFCQGLLQELKSKYSDSLTVLHREETISIERDGDMICGVTSVDEEGKEVTRATDACVIACGIASTPLCNSLNIPCPVYPAKGHLVTIASSKQCEHNMTLPGGIGYASPMAIRDLEGRHLYRLSGFVDFTLNKDTDFDRVESLIDAARIQLPDAEMVDASACHRPISADDRPIAGSTGITNLYLCTGLGSRGWSVGLGCGKLLSSIVLGLPCEIDPAPYSPKRFT